MQLTYNKGVAECGRRPKKIVTSPILIAGVVVDAVDALKSALDSSPGVQDIFSCCS